MNCDHALRVLDAGLDGELDRATMRRARGAPRRLRGLRGASSRPARRCARRSALRRAIAPPARLQAGDRAADSSRTADAPRQTPRRRSLSWAGAAALAGVAALAAFVSGLVDRRSRSMTTGRATS